MVWLVLVVYVTRWKPYDLHALAETCPGLDLYSLHTDPGKHQANLITADTGSAVDDTGHMYA